jgi:hypothetical protein
MPEAKVLLRRGPKDRAVQPWTEGAKHRVVGWVGASLVLTALSDYALALYPLGLGSAEWEMATVGAAVQGLPLLSIGLAAIWVCAGGLGKRWLLITLAWGLFVAAMVLFGSLMLFVTDIPPALQATQGVARVGIYKLVARTLFLGTLFGLGYAVAGVLALRQARGSSLKGAVA